MDKLINDKKSIKNDTVLENAIIEEEINDDVENDVVDDDDESLKENKLKKKKVKKLKIADDTKENFNIDSTKNSSKEKEEFLNDLFPKKSSFHLKNQKFLNGLTMKKFEKCVHHGLTGERSQASKRKARKA